MSGDPNGRKRVDLFALPTWAQYLIAVATVVVVVAIALLVGSPASGPIGPIAAIVAALMAFAVVAWRAQHRS